MNIKREQRQAAYIVFAFSLATIGCSIWLLYGR